MRSICRYWNRKWPHSRRGRVISAANEGSGGNERQPILDVEVAEWGIKRMRTKWGSCNRAARRVWLNLELAKKPVRCLEYIVVHELAHLRERHHNERFTGLLDMHLPQWRMCRDELNQLPLGYEEWC